MEKKVDKIDTYLGTLHVGDEVRLSWDPVGPTKNIDGIYHVYAIWATDKKVSLAFTKEGADNKNFAYDWVGENRILDKDSLLEIIPNFVNWKKILGE